MWLIFTKMPVLQPRVWFDLKGCGRKTDITTMFIRVTWMFPTTGKEIRIHTLDVYKRQLMKRAILRITMTDSWMICSREFCFIL